MGSNWCEVIMSKAGRIDTSNRIITESYSSRGGRYIAPNSPKVKSKASHKLKKGEIVLGQVLENVNKDVYKLKLPNGIFKAVVESKLKQGDKLYFFIQSISPSLVINVHSTNVLYKDNNVNYEEVIRVLGLVDSKRVRDIINEYSKRAYRLVKHVIEDVNSVIINYIKKEKKKRNLTHSLEFIFIDLYMTGYDIVDENTLGLIYNYISPSAIRMKKGAVIPNIKNIDNTVNTNSKFIKSLYIRNIIAKLNDSQMVYYINIDDNNYRVELYKKHRILQAIISDSKNIVIKLVIDERNKRAKIYYNKLDINIRKLEKISDYNVSYEMSENIFINSFTESMDEQSKRITYVV